MQTQEPSSPKDAIKAIQILFYIIVAGVILFAAITAGINFLQQSPVIGKSIAEILFFINCFIDIICYTASQILYRKKIYAALQNDLSLMEKLNFYRSALITYLALCEIPALFAIVIYFLSGNNLFLFIVCICVLTMLMKMPQKLKIFNELKLNSTEQMELN